MNERLILKRASAQDSVYPTVRIDHDLYDVICTISKETRMSKKNVVNQLITYALRNTDYTDNYADATTQMIAAHTPTAMLTPSSVSQNASVSKRNVANLPPCCPLYATN